MPEPIVFPTPTTQEETWRQKLTTSLKANVSLCFDPHAGAHAFRDDKGVLHVVVSLALRNSTAERASLDGLKLMAADNPGTPYSIFCAVSG